MVKSRQKKLDNRWGLEQSAKGGRFKLNRDLEGYHLSSRAGVDIEKLEGDVKIKINDPEPLRTTGDLLHFEAVSYAFPGAKQPLIQDVTFTLDQGGRIALVGAVSSSYRGSVRSERALSSYPLAWLAERARKIDACEAGHGRA